MDKASYIVIYLLLLLGVFYIGQQKQQAQDITSFTQEFEAYKKEKRKERDARAASPEQKEAELVRLGWQLLDQGQYRQALVTARKILVMDPESAEGKSIESVALSAMNRDNAP